MQSAHDENVQPEWSTLTRRTDDPKLTFLEGLLDTAGILHRRNGSGWHGPILQVPYKSLHAALAILEQPIGELHIGAVNKDVCWDDLPDDHEIFMGYVSQHLTTREGQPAPEPVVKPVALASQLVFFNHMNERGVLMYDVQSSNISAIGVMPLGEVIITFAASEFGVSDTRVVVFVVFKGGTPYRYYPVEQEAWAVLKAEAEDVESGQEGASVGGMFNATIKTLATEGRIKCEKYTGGMWERVWTKQPRHVKEGTSL